MIFEVYNLYTIVQKQTASEDAWLRHVLSHNKAVKGFMGITKGVEELCFYDHVEHKFPSGLLPLVTDMAREKGHTILFVDKRVKPCLPKEAKLLFLQDEIRGKYQKEAIETGVDWTRGIWWCPTAFGKTNLAIGIGKRIPCKWGFLVDETTLLGQTQDRWNMWDFDEEPAGVLGAGQWEDARFVVATYQTIIAKQDDPAIQRWIESVGGLLMDECHILSAPEYFKTAMRFANAYYRIGMSATPLSRGPWENLHVLAATGRVIYRAQVPEMVAAGVLSMPIVDMVNIEHREPMAVTWQGVYSELIVHNSKRNGLIVDKAVACEKPALIFVKQVNHGEEILARLHKKGLRAVLLHGDATLKERRAAITLMTRGELDIIVTNRIFQKGVDIPILRSVIIGSGGASVVDSLQRVGRGMRIVEGKDTFKVIDFMDRGHDWLVRHSRERKKAYKAAGYMIEDEVARPSLFTK